MTQTVTNTQSKNPEERNELIQKAIREISHIATLPEVTLKIIKLVEDPNSTAQDLNKVITNDPALGARILKVVNSAFYGLPGQISSINRAIVLLGLNAVKNIAIAASLAKLFRGGQICKDFNARDLWTHSIAVATASRLLSNELGLKLPDEAFLAGLMHDLGIMIEIQARRVHFVQVIEKISADDSLSFRAAEEEVIGANHEEFGAALCAMWKFPPSFQYVTGYHHHPMDLPEDHRTMACIVHVADIIAAKSGMGYARTIESDEIDINLLVDLNLTLEQVEKVSSELPEEMAEAANLLQDGG